MPGFTKYCSPPGARQDVGAETTYLLDMVLQRMLLGCQLHSAVLVLFMLVSAAFQHGNHFKSKVWSSAVAEGGHLHLEHGEDVDQ